MRSVLGIRTKGHFSPSLDMNLFIKALSTLAMSPVGQRSHGGQKVTNSVRVALTYVVGRKIAFKRCFHRTLVAAGM